MSQNGATEVSKVISEKKLKQVEHILELACKMQYAEITLIIERGSLRKIKCPTPVVKLKDF